MCILCSPVPVDDNQPSPVVLQQPLYTSTPSLLPHQRSFSRDTMMTGGDEEETYEQLPLYWYPRYVYILNCLQMSWTYPTEASIMKKCMHLHSTL